jgi:ribosome-binding factor A
MESNRQQKINRLIQKELSEIFLLETKKMHGVFISVTNVRVSPDLGIAHAYLSVFPSERADDLIRNINENVKSVRYDLGKRVGKQLRVVPELTFHVDDSLDYIENIDRLLKDQ